MFIFRKLKLFLISVAVLSLLCSITGCDKEKGSKSAKSTKDTGITITILSGLWSKPSEGEFVVTQVLNPFAEKLGINISFQRAPSGLAFERIKIQKAANQMSSNLEISSSGQLANWIEKDYVVDLSKYIKEWKDLKFLPAFSKGIKQDGKTYFIPICGNVYLLFANKQALKYLPEGCTIDTLTWDDFADWAINIKKGTGYGRTVISGIPLKSFIYQFGCSALSYGAGFPEIDSPGARRAWGIWERIAQADAFIPNIREIGDCSIPIIRGEAWLTILNNTKVGEAFETNETRYVIGKMPSGTKGRGAIVGFSGIGMFKGAPNQDYALKVLKHFTNPEIQVKLARGTGGFVPAEEAALKFLDDNDPQDIVIRKAMREMQGNVVISGVPAYKFKSWGAVKMVFDNLWEKVVLKKKKITEKDFANAAKQLNALRKK